MFRFTTTVFGALCGCSVHFILAELKLGMFDKWTPNIENDSYL